MWWLYTQISARLNTWTHTQYTKFMCKLKDTLHLHKHTHTQTHTHAESWMDLQGTCSVTWTSLHQQRESFAPSGLFEVISGSVIKRRYQQTHLPSATTLWQPWGYLLCVYVSLYPTERLSTPVVRHYLCASEQEIFERQCVSSNLCKQRL